MEISGLHLTQLRLLEALARNGNLTDAARQLGLTQPAASHALARLRRQVQDPLFVRTSEGMRPTPYGARLAAAVHEALQVLKDAVERQEHFEPRRSRRTFNMFMSDVGQLLYLPPLLARLSAERIDVKLRVRPVPSAAPHLMLESGEVDLDIGTFTTLVSGCMQRRLFQDRYVCIVRKDHPAFERGMSAEAFKKTPYAFADASGYVHEHLSRWLARQELRRDVKLHVPHFLALPLVVARSDLLAIMTERLANLFAEIVPLKVMPPPAKLPPYDVKMFWHERFHREPANRWLRDFVSDTLRA